MRSISGWRGQSKQPPPDPCAEQDPDLVHAYSHFLLFWVVFALIILAGIIIGGAWGAASAYLIEAVGTATPAASGSLEPPAFGKLIKTTASISIGFFVIMAALNLEYQCAVGYRLKKGIGVFLLRTQLGLLGLNLVMVLGGWL